MTALDAKALEAVTLLRRRLRDLKGLTESRPGRFTAGGRAFLELIHDDQKVIVAQFHTAGPGNAAAQRFAIDQPDLERKLLDEAKRRLARLAED